MESNPVKPNINRILVVKFGSLGDIVHCLPSVAQLRAAFPNAEIDWLVERKNKVAIELSGIQVRIVPIDTYQWRNSPQHRQREGDSGIRVGPSYGWL
jgi:heptosyltransferase-1